MASAYATFANRGVHCAPFPITRIENALGEVIWEHQPDCEQVLDTEVADRVVDIMAGSVQPGGTAPGANLGRWPTRGKTGTTNSYVDAWFVGYVKQLATAAWMGYDNGTLHFADESTARSVCEGGDTFQSGEVWVCPEPTARTLENVTIAGQYRSRVFGGTIPAPMWTDYMRVAVQDLEPAGFPDPGPLPTGSVPDLLRASTIAEAERIALAAGFRLRVTEVDDHRRSGTFLRQSPGASTRAPLGSQITLEVSNGEGQVPNVPDVVGMTAREAVDALREAGYGANRVEVPIDDPDQVGRVLAQSPGPGANLPPFEDGVSIVTIEIGILRAPRQETPVVPDDDGPDPPADDGGSDDAGADDGSDGEEDRPGRGPDGDGPPGQSSP
jgi:membrane peptidoglycan carboxypeptidase